MSDVTMGPLHSFLAGIGPDSRGRDATEVLAFSDEQLEAGHDYIQWLFPLPTQSAAQPDAPVLTESEIRAIRNDPVAADTLRRATERMLRFYAGTSWWLAWQDHNHLRITRIIRSLELLVGAAPAQRFHKAILDLHASAGAPINTCSLQFWSEAAGE